MTPEASSLAAWETFYVIVGSSCAALTGLIFVALLLSAPWREPWQAGLAAAVSGVIGAGYCVVVFRRIRRQTDYRPVREDWLWYLVLPMLAYPLLLVTGSLFSRDPGNTAFGFASEP